MTPVVFHFLTPDGLPLANVDVEIQLSRSTFDDEESGVLMPRLVTVRTDTTGKVTVPLQPGDLPYYVSVYDTASDAALSYKFYVPVLEAPNTEYRLQDLIVDGNISQTEWDTAAIQQILNAKANAMSASASAADSAAYVKETATYISGTIIQANSAAATATAMRNEAVTARDVTINARDTATSKASEATASAQAASASEAASSQSEHNAQTYKNSAKDSETNSKQSETNVKASELIVKAAELSANSAALDANTAKTAAAASATAAGLSMAAAQLAESNAKSSEIIATSAKNTASASELVVTQAQTNIQTIEQNVLSYKTTASEQATIATNKAIAAGNSASAAAQSATELSTAVNAAVAAKTAAETAKGTAEIKADVSVTKAEEARQWAITAQAAAAGAVAGQLNADWLSESGVTKILNKPVIPTSKNDFGLNLVENKSSAMIRNELTQSDVENAIKGTVSLISANNPQLVLKDDDAGSNIGRWSVLLNNNGNSFQVAPQDDAGVGSAKFNIQRDGSAKFYGPVLEIDNNPTASAVKMVINGAAGQNRQLVMSTNSLSRWVIGTSAFAESGSNSGTDLNISRYNDAGNLIDTPVLIARNTGAAIFGNTLTSNVQMNINATSGKSKYYASLTGNVLRWASGANTTAESGSNIGSDYVINRYSDTGTLLDASLSIARDTGIVSIANQLTSPVYNLTSGAGIARNTDTVFYSSVDNTIRKNTSAGMKASLGLDLVNNTTDLNKPVSNATQTALDAKAPKDSPAFTGTVTGITAAMVGLGNVSNTSDANKPVSTATQTALNAKQATSEKNASNGYAGLSGYRVGIKNDAGTFTSTIGHTNTVARNFDLPDKSGTFALMDDLANIATAPITANMTLPYGSHTICSDYTLTIPDLVQPKQMTLSSAANAVALPAKVTCVNGWTVETGYVVGQTKAISPVKYGLPQGWWGSLNMAPPKIDTKAISSIQPSSSITVIGSVVVGGSTIVAFWDGLMNAAQIFVVAINNTTGSMSNVIGVATNSGNEYLHSKDTLFAASANTFVLFHNMTTGYSVASVFILNGDGSIVNNNNTQLNTSGGGYLCTPIQLSNSTYILSGSSGQYVVTITGTTVSLGTANAYPSGNYNISMKVQPISATSFLMVSRYGAEQGTTAPSNAFAVIGNISGNTITWGSNKFFSGVSAYANGHDGLCLIPFNDNQNYLFGYTEFNNPGNTSGWVLINIVSGVITFSGNPFMVNLLPLLQEDAAGAANRQYAVKGVYPSRIHTAKPAAMTISNTQIIVTAMSVSTSVALFTRTGTAISATVANLASSTQQPWVMKAVNSANYYVTIGNSVVPLTISGTTISAGAAIAGETYAVFDNNLFDSSFVLDSVRYSWVGVPKASVPFSNNKFLSFSTWPTITTYGSMEV